MVASAPTRQQTRIVGLVYFVYFVVASIGGAIASVPLNVAGTALYFVLAAFLYRLFAASAPRAALLALPLAALGCVLQGAGQVLHDVQLLRVALIPFALFLAVIGYLITRSTFAPRALGVLLIVAGFAWCVAVLPDIPTSFITAILILGVIAELSLALWLLLRGLRRPDAVPGGATVPR